MSDNSTPLNRMRIVDVPTLLSLVPHEVRERFATRIEAVLDGLESRADYVRDVAITLTKSGEPLIRATLGGLGDFLEVLVLKPEQEPGQPTLEFMYHSTHNGEPYSDDKRIPHQLFEQRLHSSLR